jgi:hypothetical protein
MIYQSDLYQLRPFEEAVGTLTEIVEDQGTLLAKIGRINLILPISMEEKLRSCQGLRIGILRTDIIEKPYLMRIMSDERQMIGAPQRATPAGAGFAGRMT